VALGASRLAAALLFALVAACDDGARTGDADDGGDDTDGGGDTDSGGDTESDTGPDAESCDFGYEEMFSAGKGLAAGPAGPPAGWHRAGNTLVPDRTRRVEVGKGPVPDPLVMPDCTDTMPLFERGEAWTQETRCYELRDGAYFLTEDEAFDLYVALAEETTGVPLNTATEVRTVVGLRGAYPGTFAWHGNEPDLFNDTLALLWIEGDGARHVREFPAGIDTGAYPYSEMSSLRPNMRYHHTCGWHQDTYNALHMGDDAYRVRDDANSNGHWDGDRNGWLPPAAPLDFDRDGSAHNIHLACVDGPLGSAHVGMWSAGCQVLAGMANWTEFITSAWTEEGDPVDYFLLDARDLAPEVFEPCAERDGSHRCPFLVDALPFSSAGDTAVSAESAFDLYNCSAADESGPEDVYLLRLDASGTLTATVESAAPADVDVHLLDGDDELACLGRDDAELVYDITPGRYLIVVDTYFDGSALAGEYELTVTLE